MKVGIITQPLSRNYGGILQNYALQKVLIKVGHIPYTFDLGKLLWYDWFIYNLKVIIKKVLGRPAVFKMTPIEKYLKERPLRKFVDKNITLIKPRAVRPSLNKIKEYGIDAIIVGSDQVWRPCYNHNISDMYLGFAENIEVKKIAYAASFGTHECEYTPEQIDICKRLVQKFKAVSVREYSAVEICEKKFEVDATHVLDPTLLLTVDDYNSLLNDIPISTEKYLFAYILDITDSKVEFLNKLACEKKLSIIIKGADSDLLPNDSVEKWLAYFRDASYVVTDSFHGTIFSIVYNKDFFVIGNKKRGFDRFSSLLNLFNLNYRILNENNLYIGINTNFVDWSDVNKRLGLLREKSIQFLEKSIN